MAKNSLARTTRPLTKPESIKHLINIAVAEAGDKVAFKYRNKQNEIVEVTYRKCQEHTFWLGSAIKSLGMESAHIGCCGENSYDWIMTYLSALQTEGVFCPIDKELPESDLINVINGGDDEIVFCDKKREGIFKNIREQLPNVKYFVCFDREEDEGEFLSFTKLVQKGKEIFESGDRSFCDLETKDKKALKLLLYTSGTTGIAKGVMLSEHNLCCLIYYGLRLSSFRDVSLSILPYHHSFESVAGILASIHHQSTLCVNDSLKRVLKNMAVFKPGHMLVVPAIVEIMYRKIIANIEEKGKTKLIKVAIKLSRFLRAIGIDARRTIFKEIHDAFGGNLEKLICGSAPLRPEVADFFDDIGILLTNGYGITECSPLVSGNSDYDNDPRTVGGWIECIDLRIDNPNEDGEGEICVKGDTVMLGYYKNPEATAEVFDEDGYFHTGDYGKVNEKKQLLITGRKKNIIILGNGKNIYPEELENYIGNIPYALESVVYALRDEIGHESELCAECIVDPKFMEGSSIEEKVAKLKNDIFKALEKLPTYKQIKNVKIREIPFIKTTTNKIRRAKDGSPLNEEEK